MIDLRSFKKSQGIAITHPLASYQELLEKSKKSSSALANTSSDEKPTGKILNRFFGIAKPQQPNKEVESKIPTKEPVTTEILEIDAGHEELEILKEELFADVTKHQGSALQGESNEASTQSQIEATPLEIAGENIDGINEAISAEDAHLAPTATLERSLSSTTQPQSLLHSNLHSESILECFESCYASIDGDIAEQGFEITYDQLRSKRDSEEVAVLFNLALISLDKPEVTASLGSNILTSDLRQITAEELTSALAATESAMDTPVLSLKEQKAFEAQRIRGALAMDKESAASKNYKVGKKLLPASAAARFSSFILDLAICLICSAAISKALCHTVFPELKPIITDLNNQDLYTLLPIISLMLSAFTSFFFAYMVLCIYWYGKTLGGSIIGIHIVRSDLKKAGLANSCVRAFILPLSVLCFGWLPTLTMKESLHDKLARTKVLR